MELQTERLRREIGAASVACEVIRHNRKTKKRLITIHAMKENEREVQSIAYTSLCTEKWTPEVLAIDRLLESGNLMGETFKKHGMKVRQNRLFRLRLPLCNIAAAQLYGVAPWQVAEVECYEFWADEVLYGTVVEIKNPTRRQAPTRPWLGRHTTLSRFNFALPDFFTALDGTQTPPTHALLIARSAGILQSLVMYFFAQHYTRRYISTTEARLRLT